MPLPETTKASAQFIDRDFQSDSTGNYRLSIQLRLNGFSFAQIDRISKKVLSIEDFHVPLMLGEESVYQNEKVNLRLEKVLNEKQLNLQLFKSVHFVFDNPFFVLLPSLLMDANSSLDYLKQIHQIPENFIVKSDELRFLEATNVYALYAPLYYNLADYFPRFTLKHASSVFIQQMALSQKMRKGTSVFVEVGDLTMHILVFKDEKLEFSNTFAFKEKEDFIYFILLVYNQLNLNPESTPLYFSGQIDRSSPLYAIAYQYIGVLDFIDINASGLVFGKEIPETVGLKYTLLTQAVLCE
ncbi:MAG: DUF3822 family protein [Bacteroidales bacterium]|nr:DUF3822 family protein [Bacteroidales bacterium]